MTEGSVSQWKKKEGEAFQAGDVLLEVVCVSSFVFLLELTCPKETDKATIDVEAQDGGIMGKIIVCEHVSRNACGMLSMQPGAGWDEEHPCWQGHRAPR